MTTIKESLHVECPYVRAKQYLHDTLTQACANSSPQRLRLTAPLPGTQIEFEKTVLVRYACGTDPMHFDEPWVISWEAEQGGVYPSFSGVLTVCADEDYGGAILELSGTYTPPLGGAGAVFDKALGRKIASATMQTLLAQIAGEMLQRYQREEAAKAATAPQS